MSIMKDPICGGVIVGCLVGWLVVEVEAGYHGTLVNLATRPIRNQ